MGVPLSGRTNEIKKDKRLKRKMVDTQVSLFLLKAMEYQSISYITNPPLSTDFKTRYDITIQNFIFFHYNVFFL